MLELGIVIAGGMLLLTGLVVTLKVLGWALRLVVFLLLLPLHILGAVLALVGGLLFLPLLVLALVLGGLGLAAGLLIAPLLPVAFGILALVALVRLLRPTRVH